MKNWIWYDVRSEIMTSIAKMFLSKRKQHDVRRRRRNGNRKELENHDVAGQVDTGGLEHALFTQVLENVRWNDAASVPPLDEKARPFLFATLVLPSLFALLQTPKGGSVRQLCSTTNFRTLRNCRQRPTIRQIFRKPEKSHCNSRGITCRPGRRLIDLSGRAARPKRAQPSVFGRNAFRLENL